MSDDSEIEVSDSSDEDEDDISVSEIREVFVAVAFKGNCERLKQVRVKHSNVCIHCGHGGTFYELVKALNKYAVFKYFRCLTYDMEDISAVKWVGVSLAKLPTKYRFLQPYAED